MIVKGELNHLAECSGDGNERSAVDGLGQLIYFLRDKTNNILSFVSIWSTL